LLQIVWGIECMVACQNRRFRLQDTTKNTKDAYMHHGALEG